ncbi:hypothetical protein QE152_g36904 [Popillia japonica]|uniref:Uncharacterized protein n=1 Tax=Popillia japonica TaxID=7064 RepID=A0AAW1IC94_POPJA
MKEVLNNHDRNSKPIMFECIKHHQNLIWLAIENIVIVKADKKNAIILLNKEDYHKKMLDRTSREKHLQDDDKGFIG